MWKMRWAAIVFLLQLFTSAWTAESDDDAPSLHIMARSLVYNVGEKKGIFCKGKNLNESIEWYSPSGKVEGLSSKNDRVFVERQRNDTLPLIIISAQLEDTGNWTCKSGTLEQTLKIVVGEKVNLSPKEENVDGEETKSIKFECVAKGHPRPVVQWYNAKGTITDDRKKYIIKQKGDNCQLEIRNLTHLDTGEYWCKATQEALSYYSLKRVFLTVQHKPIIYNHVTQEMFYSKFKTEEVYAIMNETKNITCSVTAHPPPTFKWNKRNNGYDEEINDEDVIDYSSNGTRSFSVLQLKLYSKDNLGEYKCSVSNEKGHVSIVFHVQLGNKPNPPDSINFVSATATELTFNVTCTTCNFAEQEEMSPNPANLTVLGYTFELVPVRTDYPADWNSATEFNIDIKFSNDTLFTVGPLANKTTYHVRVSTRNAAGNSDWLEIIGNPSTSFATTVLVSITLFLATLMINSCY